MKELVSLAIKEDVGEGDITSDNIFSDEKGTGVIKAKQNGVIAGLDVADSVCKEFKLKFDANVKEGKLVKAGDVVAEVSGKVRDILKSERIILNFLCRLSGVATATRHFVDKVKKYNVRVMDTRKTTPGHRDLEKRAVVAGGGENHRMGLYDMVLIKDNHIKAAGSIKDAVHKVREKITADIKVEVECESLDQVKEALDSRVDRIMFDNMDLETMKKAVQLVNKATETEASGGVTFENIEDYAKTGVDCISVGALTHSIKSLNLSMEMK